MLKCVVNTSQLIQSSDKIAVYGTKKLIYHNILLRYNFFYESPVLKILTYIFLKLHYLYADKKSYSDLYKTEELGFFLCVTGAQSKKNTYQHSSICHWLVFTGVCGLSPSKTNSQSNYTCEKKYSKHLILYLFSSCQLLLHSTVQTACETGRSAERLAPASIALLTAGLQKVAAVRIQPAASLEYCFATLIIASWKDTTYVCHAHTVWAFFLLPRILEFTIELLESWASSNKMLLIHSLVVFSLTSHLFLETT